jgi:hypothetical protein
MQYVTRPGQVRTSTVKKSVPARTAICAPIEILPGCNLDAFGRRSDAVSFENVSDCLIRNVVTEVDQRPGNPIIASTGILLGHADDERFDRSLYTRTSWISTMLRAVELAGNQTMILGQNGIWLGNTGHLRQMCSAQGLGDLGKCKPFSVSKLQALCDARAVNSILRNQVFALEERARSLYQAGDVRQ